MKKKKQIQQPSYTIKDSQFYGVKWDAEALRSVELVAKGLLNLTELFKSQNINIESFVKMGPITPLWDKE